MSISRGTLRGMILRYLNKTSDYTGFYDEEKVNDAIQEALDAVAVHMFLAGDGWLTKYIYLDTTAGQVSLDIPGNVAMIREVRYKINDIYYPLTYDDKNDSYSYIGSGQEQAFAFSFRLLGNQIIFDPPLAEGGARYLQIEAVYYPAQLIDENQVVDQQFDRSCINYVKYKACSVLAGSIEKSVRPWAQEESEWFALMQSVVTRRNLKSTRIQEFLP